MTVEELNDLIARGAAQPQVTTFLLRMRLGRDNSVQKISFELSSSRNVEESGLMDSPRLGISSGSGSGASLARRVPSQNRSHGRRR